MPSAVTFAEFFKEQRIKTGKTLRQFCLDNGFDAGNISKLERGLLPPPESTEKLVAYAHALEIREGSNEWFDLFDLAAVARGQVPARLMNDAELVARLPVVFRTLEGKRVTPEQVDDLIALIRRSEGYADSESAEG